MKITKRQLRKIIREAAGKFPAFKAKKESHVPGHSDSEDRLSDHDVEELMGDVEAALGQLTTTLAQLERLDPQASMDAARYVAEEIHSWR